MIGFAALGAILFSRVEAAPAYPLPGHSEAARKEITRVITRGNLHAAQLVERQSGASSFAQLSFWSGYEAVLFKAGAIALIAAALSWMLIDAGESTAGSREHPGPYCCARRLTL